MKVHYVRNNKISVVVIIAAMEIRIFVSELSSICTAAHKRYTRLNHGSMFKHMDQMVTVVFSIHDQMHVSL